MAESVCNSGAISAAVAGWTSCHGRLLFTPPMGTLKESGLEQVCQLTGDGEKRVSQLAERVAGVVGRNRVGQPPGGLVGGRDGRRLSCPESGRRTTGRRIRHGSGSGREADVGDRSHPGRQRTVRRSPGTGCVARPFPRDLVSPGRSSPAAGAGPGACDDRGPAAVRERRSWPVAFGQCGGAGGFAGDRHAGAAPARVGQDYAQAGLVPLAVAPPGVPGTRPGPGHPVDVERGLPGVCRIPSREPAGPGIDPGSDSGRAGLPVGRVPVGPGPRDRARLAIGSAVRPCSGRISAQL